ncbi:hypothetical protein ABBQ38_008740 [Trebouxia sp. C0009 RCD-2024]
MKQSPGASDPQPCHGPQPPQWTAKGLGFGSSAAPSPVVDNPKNSADWEAPYKLSDKFQQAPEISTSKRSRSPHHHKHAPEKRKRAHSSSSPGRPPHRNRDKAAHHKQAGKEQRTRHHSSRDVKEEHHRNTRQSSRSPDDRHRRQHHRGSGQAESKRDSDRHTSRREQSPHTHHERHRHHRSSDLRHREHHTSRSRSGATTSRRQASVAPKPPDYAKLIVGYKYMSDANRLKVVTAYKLQKTSAKDVTNQDGQPWTRFVFNKEALLEEEGAAPDGPDLEGQGPAGLGAFDFRPHRSAKIGKPAEDAHEAAIFGAPAAACGMQPLRHSLPLASGSESDERPQVVELQEQAAQLPPTITSDAANAPLVEPAPATAGAPKMSWRERALLKKQQQFIT